MRGYFRYWLTMLRYTLVGPLGYYLWVLLLLSGVGVGALSYVRQLELGLVVTNLSQQVSWGAYIANFTFLVGIAAAAVLLVVPSYIYHREDIKQVVLVGELMAVSAIVMCLLFVTVDIGRPDRVTHMLPGLGRLNFPRSILAWDVVVLSGYLVLNAHIPGYLLYKRFRGEQPSAAYYLPFTLLSIAWALSIHTVTAFLYSGLGGRPYWNTAVLAPRFLVSAFASGPALLLIVLTTADRLRAMHVPSTVFDYLCRVISFTLPLNFFLLGCELFSELYTNSMHAVSAHYLFFGLHGHAMLQPYIWSGLGLSLLATVIFLRPSLRVLPGWRLVAALCCVVGIWIEKGMGLIVPGFIPSPAGDLVEYRPSLTEFFVCAGIWSLGALLFTVMARVALAIQTGRIGLSRRPAAERGVSS